MDNNENNFVIIEAFKTLSDQIKIFREDAKIEIRTLTSEIKKDMSIGFTQIKCELEKINNDLGHEHDINIVQNEKIKHIENDIGGISQKMNNRLDQHEKEIFKNTKTNYKTVFLWGFFLFVITGIGMILINKIGTKLFN